MKQALSLPSLIAVLTPFILFFLLSPQLMADDNFSSQPPANDNCEDADPIQNSSSSEDIWCGEGTLVGAGTADIDAGNILTPNENMESHLINALDSSNSVVWYEFATDSTTDWVHIEVDFDVQSFTESGMVLFRSIDGCDSLEMLAFSQVNVTGNGFINSGEVMPNEQYKLMIFGPMEDSLDFDLCLNLSTSVLCETDAHYYYNHAEIFCGLHLLDGYCLQMGSPIMDEYWPACDSCCTMQNPQWIVFSTGYLEGEELSIWLEVYECMINRGVQIAIYDLGCETEFNQDTTAAGLIPEEEMLVTDCALMVTPQAGVLEVTIDSFHPGKVYGLVIDGWSADQCKVDILEILIDGESPEVEGDLSEGIDWCFEYTYGFELIDTVCVGALNVHICLEGTGLPGICTYTWTVDGEVIEGTENQSEIYLDFPESGDYEICVVAKSSCGSSIPLCRDIVAYPKNPKVTRDTICMREEYVWEGPEGSVGDGVYGPYNEDVSHLDFSFEGLSVNSVGCQIDAFLELHVIGDNYFNPTELEAVICRGDTYYFPEQGHPETLVFDATGVYGLDGDVFIAQEGEPGSLYQCDSFFVLDLAVIAVDVLDFVQTCEDSIFRICTASPGLIFPDMGIHAVDVEITWEWVRLSDGAVLDSGDNSMENFICAEFPVSKFLNSEEENLEFRMKAHIDGEPGSDGCDFEVPWTVFLVLYLPLTPEVESDDVFLIGDVIPVEITNVPFIDIDYHWSFSQEPDTIIGDPNGTSLELVFSDPGTVEICVYGQNDCASSETHCFEIEIETDVSVPPVATQKQELEWFPNPVTDALHMRSDTPLGETEIQVFDTRGVLVYQGTEDIGEEYRFSTADLPSGVYVLRLVFEDGIGFHKMVVQK